MVNDTAQILQPALSATQACMPDGKINFGQSCPTAAFFQVSVYHHRLLYRGKETGEGLVNRFQLYFL